MDPREQKTRSKVMAAARELLIEGGPGAITHSAVAERADVGRTTLYRHWPNHDVLIEDALSVFATEWESHLTGDTRTDLTKALAKQARIFTQRTNRMMALTFLERAEHDNKTAATKRALEKRNPVRLVLMRAVESGQLSADIDIDQTTSQLTGPILHACLHAHRKVQPAEIANLVDQFLSHHQV